MRVCGLILAVAWLIGCGPAAFASHVGFQTTVLDDGQPLPVGIWYPTDAPDAPRRLGSYTQNVALNAAVVGSALPLVVISHGSGGWFGGHYDTALALARAGFIVAAVTQEGDSVDDGSRRAEIWRRPAQLKRLTDYMVAQWPQHARIDPDRIGAFGFSAGGFTVLVTAGGVPDLGRIPPYCLAHPDTETCNAMQPPDEVRRLLAIARDPSTWVHDPRIKAVVVAAPALGFSFAGQGLSSVHVPVQLWRDEHDQVLPDPDYATAVRAALPAPPEYHVVASADHYDFLPPCPPKMAEAQPKICQSRPGFDRAAFHQQFDRDVVRFFARELGQTGATE